MNRQLNKQLNGGAAAPATTIQPGQLPAQMVSGWRVSLYDCTWEGEVRERPLPSFYLRNQRINAALGQRPIDRSNIRECHAGATDEMFIYQLSGWLHVTRPVRYELGFEHPCNLVVRVGGAQPNRQCPRPQV